MKEDTLTRLTLNIPTSTIVKVEEYAKEMGINRTSAICVLLNTSLEYRRTMSNLDALSKMYEEEKSKRGD